MTDDELSRLRSVVSPDAAAVLRTIVDHPDAEQVVRLVRESGVPLTRAASAIMTLETLSLVERRWTGASGWWVLRATRTGEELAAGLRGRMAA